MSYKKKIIDSRITKAITAAELTKAVAFPSPNGQAYKLITLSDEPEDKVRYEMQLVKLVVRGVAMVEQTTRFEATLKSYYENTIECE